ncbi:hypothetical protein SEA_LUCKYSOCKE_112 [Streptomyces phage LuckySocke]|nr:hypothetical protein SEA_ALONE_114 [Streptomyces phage Alone3]WPH58956.1 hypothetical protein SEA_LUCKYSOCKE_112 [Streptomyces phage LuckySocke]
MGDKTLRDDIEALLKDAKSPVSVRVMANRIARRVKNGK